MKSCGSFKSTGSEQTMKNTQGQWKLPWCVRTPSGIDVTGHPVYTQGINTNSGFIRESRVWINEPSDQCGSTNNTYRDTPPGILQHCRIWLDTVSIQNSYIRGLDCLRIHRLIHKGQHHHKGWMVDCQDNRRHLRKIIIIDVPLMLLSEWPWTWCFNHFIINDNETYTI